MKPKTIEMVFERREEALAGYQYVSASKHNGLLVVLCHDPNCLRCQKPASSPVIKDNEKATIKVVLESCQGTAPLDPQDPETSKFYIAHKIKVVQIEKTVNEYGFHRLPSLDFNVPTLPNDALINLGRQNQVGASCFAYKEGDERLIVDCGITLGQEADDDFLFPSTAQVTDDQLPNLKYLDQWSKTVVGIIFTHGHLDHCGGLPNLGLLLEQDNGYRPWGKLKVYATPLAEQLLRKRFGFNRYYLMPKYQVFQPGDTLNCGSFTVQTFPVYHSIPETCGLLITTPKGRRLVHLTDFKLRGMGQATPSLLDTLKTIREKGEIDLMVMDVMNAQMPGMTRSEQEPIQAIEQIVTERAKLAGRIVIAFFSTNLERMRAIIEIGGKTKREVSLYGRGMRNMYDIGRQLELLPDLPTKSTYGQLLIVTGCQAESESVLDRWAKGDRDYGIGGGARHNDTIILSARAIPGTGNEARIKEMIKQLTWRNANVLYDPSKLHVSGHGCLEDMLEVVNCLQPRKVVPIHADEVAVQTFRKALQERNPTISCVASEEMRSGVAL